ncbi:xylosyl- and glucuronyltransferase LARGE1-like isoform X2 [Amphiura filiformis]|uniref:xylosyl- and glucuronyltransferase LARGE1-like isoform X1 n=1 Tax=Amphiura filiformis TaxID=82378 RepID=UPI003B216A77
MPHVRWNPEIDCNTGQPGICSKVLSVRCKPDSIRAIYQYLPINIKASEIKSIYFSATSSSSALKRDATYNIMVESAMYSAIALLKYTDDSQDRMRLDFPTGTHPYIKAELDKVVPSDKQLQSVTVMLCCYGYHGSVKFLDIIVKPIIESVPTPGPLLTEPSHYIEECPDYSAPTSKQQAVSFHSEQIFTSDLTEITEEVTLVTHVSMDRIDILQRTIEHWNGPLSVVLFVPTKSKSEDENHEWKRYYIKKKLKDTKFQTKCDLTAFYAKTVDDDYPINYLRNKAISQAKTQYLLLLDADFIPSPNLEQSFQSTLRGFKPSLPQTKVAYVVPAFEYSEDAKEPLRDPPSSKEELKEKIFGVGANIIPFRHFISPESHRPTDYRAWYTSKEPYKVINYEDKFEPYIIIRKTSDLPLFDENFSGYGMNKVAHTMELLAAGFTFEVLPNIWAIHLPHRVTTYNTNFLTDPLERLQNRITRFEFVAKIMKKYGLGPCGQNR